MLAFGLEFMFIILDEDEFLNCEIFELFRIIIKLNQVIGGFPSKSFVRHHVQNIIIFSVVQAKVDSEVALLA